MTTSLRPAALAFDAIAPSYDARFGAWASVAAQRRAVRAALVRQFPAGGRILEVGGGTGEDALYLAQKGFDVLLTDPSPTMVKLSSEKLASFHAATEVVTGEELAKFAKSYLKAGSPKFDGAFSNFAPLNCVADLTLVAHGLAQFLKPGAAAMLVFFGTCSPGEMIVETLRGRTAQALRRRKRGKIRARVAKREFDVVYHRPAEIQRAFAPWFTLERRIGIGIAVPPSAAEPWISEHPRLLSVLESVDNMIGHPFALLGDHVLYQFRRRAECSRKG
jgi:SAM-dependent methyltransferase